MKHLNANLDNVTNVELKETATGGTRIIGVDSTGDIVEVTLPASTGGGGSVNVSLPNQIERGESFYFEGVIADFDSACWAEGATVTLTTDATNHGGISIVGTISVVEERFNYDTSTYDTIRITAINAGNTTGATDAFSGGQPNYSPTLNFYDVDTTANYTLSVPACIADVSTGVGFDRNSDSASFYGQNHPFGASGSINPTDNRAAIESRPTCRWIFWGFDEDENGNQILHPDTGIPSIVVAEYARTSAQTYGTGADHPNNPPSSWFRNLGTTATGQGWLFGTNQVIGGAPYPNQVEHGSANATRSGYIVNTDPRGASFNEGLEGTTRVTWGNGWGGNDAEFANINLGGLLPAANTPSRSRASANNQVAGTTAKTFFVWAPATTNCGLTRGTDQGWSPFFSVVSGSGAVRASDGRYYINATPAAPLLPSSPFYDEANPDALDISGFYLNGEIVEGEDGRLNSLVDDRGSVPLGHGWTERLDRTIYRVTDFTNSNSTTMSGWRYVRTLDRDTFGLSDTVASLGEDVNGVRVIVPVETDAEPTEPVANQNAFSRVVSGSEVAEADEVQDTLTLIAGDNISIDIEEGTDTITISSSDEAEITNITNLLDGLDVVDVSGATDASPIAVPDGDIAYVSETELYVNNTGASVDVGLPSTFFHENNVPPFPSSTLDPDFPQRVPDGWLRIGTEEIRDRSVIDVSDTTSIDLVPDGAIAWISPILQYWNASGINQFVLDPSTVSFATDPNWLQIGDGNSDADLSHTDIDDAPVDATVDRTIMISDHGLTGNNFSVQTYEEIGAAMSNDWSLFLPDTLIIRSNGNIEITIPGNTVAGRVKTEIRA